MAARIQEGSDKSLTLTADDGKETTYYPDRQVFVTLGSLKVVKSLEQSAEDGGRPKFTTSVSGVATLNGGSMAAIGIPSIPSAKSFALGITGTEESTEPVPNSEASELVGPFGQSVGMVHLDFAPSDWELDTEDSWFLHLTISIEAIADIAGAINDRSNVAMEACLRLKNIYSRAHPMAPISRQEDMFLRPRNFGSEDRHTQPAYGVVVGLRLFDAPLPVMESIEEDEVEPAPKKPDPLLLLADRIEQARITIKWVGGLLIGAVIFLALRTH
jgi:hypothetical protein